MNGPSPVLPNEPQLGQSVGPYRLQGKLGGGGMGHVYKAVGPDGTPVALKTVKEDLAHDWTFRKRFAREARIARSISHPNIVPAIDSGEHLGIPYLVQTFVEGGSVEGLIKERGKLDLETATGVCSDVAAGLDALHDYARQVGARLVHRDVKPGNILLDRRGTAYLTDFGLAKDSRGTVLTKFGQALGTPDYMAPEQIRCEDVGAATDVYALGCVVYECLSGRPPFADSPGMRVLWAQLYDPAPDCPDLGPDVRLWVSRALEKDPASRPQSAGELARGLRQAAGLA